MEFVPEVEHIEQCPQYQPKQIGFVDQDPSAYEGESYTDLQNSSVKVTRIVSEQKNQEAIEIFRYHTHQAGEPFRENIVAYAAKLKASDYDLLKIRVSFSVYLLLVRLKN